MEQSVRIADWSTALILNPSVDVGIFVPDVVSKLVPGWLILSAFSTPSPQSRLADCHQFSSFFR
jgi:hypothetical protein